MDADGPVSKLLFEMRSLLDQLDPTCKTVQFVKITMLFTTTLLNDGEKLDDEWCNVMYNCVYNAFRNEFGSNSSPAIYNSSKGSDKDKDTDSDATLGSDDESFGILAVKL
eukprot:TRINITY_DN479_c0_g1_i1.p1 TRINITY_DN479_c0_g1~~TRINITY_DN479_c0_g1_i1.p1  ORF type:complete len:110 (+),score=5.34 TRINITY_DN479_c0_g1_i1:230-559(+)